MTPAETRTAALSEAAAICDWQQVVMNGGPPCFHVEDGSFCLRAQRWAGHDGTHRYVSLADILRVGNAPGSSESSPEVAAALERWERTTGDVVHFGIGEVYKAGAELARLLRSTNPSKSSNSSPEPVPDTIHIVFDGAPGPEAGRFVECETPDGKSIRAGEWRQVGDYWHLIIRRGREVAP